MRNRIVLLFATALFPFVIQLCFPFASSYAWIPGGGFAFYLFTGLAWSFLFTYTCYRASKGQIKRLFLLLPLLLFATGGPAYFILLTIALWVQSLRGVALP
jgi:hypothetical protein